MAKKRFLARFLTVTLTTTLRDLASSLVDVVFSETTDEVKAEEIGELVDDSILLGGPLGVVLEGLDDDVAEDLAGLSLALIEQTQEHVVGKLSERIEEAEEELRDRGVPESAIEAMRDALRLDDLAA